MESSSQLFLFGIFELAVKSCGYNKNIAFVCILWICKTIDFMFVVCHIFIISCLEKKARKWVVLNWGFPRNVSRCTSSCQLMEYPIESLWHTLVHRWVSMQGCCFSCARDKCGNMKRSHLLPFLFLVLLLFWFVKTKCYCQTH